MNSFKQLLKDPPAGSRENGIIGVKALRCLEERGGDFEAVSATENTAALLQKWLLQRLSMISSGHNQRISPPFTVGIQRRVVRPLLAAR